MGEVIILKKGSRFFPTVCVLLFGLFLGYFGYLKASEENIPVSAYEDVSQYSVYSGRDVYEYYKSTLDENEQTAYEEMKEAFLQFKEQYTTSVEGLTKDDMSEVFYAIVLDHPEIFWLDSYTSPVTMQGKIDTQRAISLTYAFTQEESIYYKDIIETSLKTIVDEANKYKSDFDKVKFVHDRLVEIGTYRDYTPEERTRFQSIVSILQDGETVCAGFTYSFKMIMDRLGIQAVTVADISENGTDESHVWNMVYLDDEWFNIDITFDNKYSTDTDISHTYFMQENQYFYLTHKKQPNQPGA